MTESPVGVLHIRSHLLDTVSHAPTSFNFIRQMNAICRLQFLLVFLYGCLHTHTPFEICSSAGFELREMSNRNCAGAQLQVQKSLLWSPSPANFATWPLQLSALLCRPYAVPRSASVIARCNLVFFAPLLRTKWPRRKLCLSFSLSIFPLRCHQKQ